MTRIVMKDIPKNQHISKDELKRIRGGTRGTYWLPEVGDEVLVAFMHGDMRRPFVVGSLWNGKDVPPGGDSTDSSDTKTAK